MTCKSSAKLLALFALSPREARRVAEHLESCVSCRTLQSELVRSRRWIESAPAPPLAEEDFAAMRRAVWREIEARGLDSRKSASTARSLTFAALGLAAAAFAVVWLARGVEEPAPQGIAAPTAAPLVSALPGPASTGGTQASPASAPSAVSPAPVARAVRAARRRAAPAGEPGFSRIEFRTANPNVRVIWLVGKGRDASAPLASRNREVS